MNKDINYTLTTAFLLLLGVILYYTYMRDSKLYFGSYNNSEHSFSISGKAHIIDGDSVKINNYEIRLIDIDAPEYKQTCYNSSNKVYNCGKLALKFLRNQTNNKNIKCNINGKDYYSRFLATCYILDVNLNSLMVENGWAINYSSSNKYYNKELLAKKNKIGLWQGDFITPRQYRKLNPRF